MKQTILAILKKIGYGVTRDGRWGYRVTSDRPKKHGDDPFRDMEFFLKGIQRPTVFDVGANVGQSVDRFKKSLPDCHMYSFEPSPITYAKLREHCNGMANVTTLNCGVGSRQSTMPFLENTHSDMSSFLEPSDFAWGKVEKVTNVDVITLDLFSSKNNIDFIHVLKSDTQGYDFEVFKGADGLMKDNKIGLVYFEFTFSDMYKGLPKFHDVFRFLSERNFSLVSFYQAQYQQDILGWADFLFINSAYNHRRVEQGAAPAPWNCRVTHRGSVA